VTPDSDVIIFLSELYLQTFRFDNFINKANLGEIF
jgi:hypothetical protein